MSMSDTVREIVETFLIEVPRPDYACADDESSFGMEWHFKDGSVFWIDIDPVTGPRYLWRKGRDGKAVSASIPPAELTET